VAVDAAKLLAEEKINVSVVSMPSWDRFNALSQAQRAAVLPPQLPRVSVEAASTFGWAAYATHCVGIDRFGASAPGAVVMKHLGITAHNVAAVTKSALGS
jgi:transketolase